MGDVDGEQSRDEAVLACSKRDRGRLAADSESLAVKVVE